MSVDFADDGFGGPGPGEGTRIVVVLGDVAVDRRLEVHDRAEVTSPELPSRQGREERLDGVDPRGRGWGEVEHPAGVS